MKKISLLTALLCVCLMSGCQATRQSYRDDLATARMAQEQGQYAVAYELSRSLVDSVVLTETERIEAAYIAGLAAHASGVRQDAAAMLRRAARHPDSAIADQARLQLGLVQCELREWASAAAVLDEVAPRLKGDQFATARFFSGTALAKLNRVDEARTRYRLAARYAVDTELRERALEYAEVTGYTIQVGTFGNRANANECVELWRERATSKGYRVRVFETKESNRDVFRVFIGSFGTWHAAEQARSSIGAELAHVRSVTPD